MIEFESLIPECYAPFRPLILDGLQFFLGRLGTARRTTLLAAQAQLGTGCPPETRMFALMRACPTLHKLGQILARHRALNVALRAELQKLESLPPALALADVRSAIERELGPRSAEVVLDEPPLAEGSIAVIVPFCWHDPAVGTAQHGVFKLLAPGVAERVAEELEILRPLGEFLEARSAALDLPSLGYTETFEQIRGMLEQEIDLQHEQANLRYAADFYARDADVCIPLLLPLCTPRLTAMERIVGHKITDAAALPEARRRALAHALVRTLLARPFFHDADDAMFHGDPHAGNLLLDDRERLVLLDWSLAGHMNRKDRRDIVALLLGALMLDRRTARAGLAAIMAGRVDDAALDRHLQVALQGVPWAQLPDFGWLIALLDGLVRDGFALRPEFTLFRKSLFTLRGVLRDLSEEASLNQPIALAGASQFAREYSSRMLLLYGTRSYGTHMTNRDLARVVLRWPLTAVRYWLGGWRELGRRAVRLARRD